MKLMVLGAHRSATARAKGNSLKAWFQKPIAKVLTGRPPSGRHGRRHRALESQPAAEKDPQWPRH
jgi:hypothetical protein